MNELKKQEGYARSSTDDQGRLLIQYTGDYNVVADSHVNLADRLKAIDKAGIDMQVLTLTTPGVERETAERGIKLSRLTNDEFGQIKEKYPDRFTALAALPYQDPQAAVTELERAVQECGLPGVMLFSNVNGRPLDSKEFLPIYEKAVKLDVPLFMHPSVAINLSAMDDYRLT